MDAANIAHKAKGLIQAWLDGFEMQGGKDTPVRMSGKKRRRRTGVAGGHGTRT